jgi:hypothetical protein
MSVRINDRVSYLTRNGTMQIGTVLRKVGAGMVDIRLDGSGREVRQAATALTRVRTNGWRARRNSATSIHPDDAVIALEIALLQAPRSASSGR